MVLVERITPETLRNWLESPNPPAVVDVRDDDHIGGHVKGSIHVPSMSFRRKVDQSRQDLQSRDKVVFYCQFSQQRGPSCAQHFAGESTGSEKPPTVYILDGGFSNWATTFDGKDGHTENFQHDSYA